MRRMLSYVFLFFALLMAVTLKAEEAAFDPKTGAAVPHEADAASPNQVPKPSVQAEEEDPFKDIVVYDEPKDFATAKQLALKNRVERMERIEKVMDCINKTTNIEGIYACKELEVDYTVSIRLAYCKTGVSWLVFDSRKPNKDGKVEPSPTECEKALQNIENVKERRRNLKKQVKTPGVTQ